MDNVFNFIPKTNQDEEIPEKSEFIDSDSHYILGNLDNIYFNIKEPSNYLKNVSSLLLIISFLNNSALWTVKVILSSPDTYNIYCYNTLTENMDKVSQESFCESNNNSNYRNIYIDSIDDNPDIIDEIYYMNKNFSNYFKNLAISEMNFNLLDGYDNKFSEYKGCIVKTNNYDMFLKIKLRNICEDDIYKCNFFFGLGIFLSGTLFSIFSSIYGRKIGIILGLIISISGFTLLSLMSFLIFNIPNDKFGTDSVSITLLILDNIKLLTFYSQFKGLIYFSILLIGIGIIMIDTIGLAFLLELAFRDEDVFDKFFFNFLCVFISGLIAFYFSIWLKKYHIILAIYAVLYLIFVIITISYFPESPRFHFEHNEWKEITRFLQKVVKGKELDKFYRDEVFFEKFTKYNDDILTKIKEKIILESGNKMKKSHYYRQLFLYIQNQSFNEKYPITFSKHELKVNPFLISRLIFNEKRRLMRKYLPTLIIFFLSSFSFSSAQMNLIHTQLNMPSVFQYSIIKMLLIGFFYIIIFIFISLFLYLSKFFGLKIVFHTCFFFNIVFSAIFIIYTFQRNLMINDYNIYSASQYDDYSTSYYFNLFTFLSLIIFFFSSGLYFCTYLYLITLTKTITRVQLFGYFSIGGHLMFIYSVILIDSFHLSPGIIFISGILGIFSTFFLEEMDEFNIIKDNRKVEFPPF